jgi:hypothetical protein
MIDVARQRRHSRRGRRLSDRQPKPKRRAALGVVAGADFAAVQKHQLAADGKTEAGAFFAAGGRVAEAGVFLGSLEEISPKRQYAGLFFVKQS